MPGLQHTLLSPHMGLRNSQAHAASWWLLSSVLKGGSQKAAQLDEVRCAWAHDSCHNTTIPQSKLVEYYLPEDVTLTLWNEGCMCKGPLSYYHIT